MTRLSTYFCDLWVFLPYLMVYLLWWTLGWATESLTTTFQIIHGINIALLALVVCQDLGTRWRFKNIGNAIFWIALALLVLLPGAYLEYPSDPWEHFRRLMRWQAGGEIGQYPADSKFKFSYFFGWSFFQLVSIESRRTLLDYYSAASQLLVLAQIFRLLSFMTRPAIAVIGVLIFISAFGTSIFGLRYYALSSSLLAYAAYLQVILLVLKSEKLSVFALHFAFLTTLIFFNHRQELIFLGLLAPIALFYRSWSHISAQMRATSLKVIYSVAIAGFLIGPIVRQFGRADENMDLLTGYGGVAIWSSLYVNTLGVTGLLGLLTSILCLVFRRGNILLSSFVVAPAFILVWPPTALVLTFVLPNQYLSYRILYAFTAGLGVLSLFEFLERWATTKRLEILVAASLLGFLVYAGVSPQAPWRGRLWFAAYRPPVEREYNHLMPMVRWFSDHWDLKQLRRCWIMSDDISRSLLVTHFGVEEKFAGGDSVRRGLRLDAKYNVVTEGLVAAAQADKNLCGFLVYKEAGNSVIPESSIGRLSGHWHSENGDVNWLVDKKFIEAAEKLVDLGWRRETLPQGYLLYTRPEQDK